MLFSPLFFSCCSFFSLLHFVYGVFCVVVGFFPLVLHIVWFILHCFIFFSVFHVRCVISIRCKFKKWISTASKRPCLKTLKIAGLWQWYSDIERCTNGNVRSLASLCLWVCVYILICCSTYWCKSVSLSHCSKLCIVFYWIWNEQN